MIRRLLFLVRGLRFRGLGISRDYDRLDISLAVIGRTYHVLQRNIDCLALYDRTTIRTHALRLFLERLNADLAVTLGLIQNTRRCGHRERAAPANVREVRTAP